MKKYIPFNNIIVCKILEKAQESAIVMPDDKRGRFIRIEILAKGNLVNPNIEIRSICIANNLFEAINLIDPDIGFINEKDILATEINEKDILATEMEVKES